MRMLLSSLSQVASSASQFVSGTPCRPRDPHQIRQSTGHSHRTGATVLCRICCLGIWGEIFLYINWTPFFYLLQLRNFAIPCSSLNVCCQDFLHKLRGVYLKLVQCSHTIAEQYLLSEKSGHTILVSSWAASSSPWQTWNEKIKVWKSQFCLELYLL